MRKFHLKFWSGNKHQLLKEYSLEFRNLSEAYQYIKDLNGIPITVTEVKQPVVFMKRLS